MNPHISASALRLTPSNSPFFKSASPRSPTKNGGNSSALNGSNSRNSEEPGLRLQKVIGTTAASANGFDCVPATRQFAYTAGAAAVVATVSIDDLTVSQRFFRARPSLAGVALRDGAAWLLGATGGTPGESRARTFGLGRDSGINGSPLSVTAVGGGGAGGRDWLDSPTGRTPGSTAGGAKDRVKAATSVALAPNGKWVAVGETGYRPRVLLFANNSDGSSELPVVALAEHTFGVRALAFSPDSRLLASLGTVNDGFLYIWAIDDRSGLATLLSSNKCTAMINSMVWIGRSLLTAGLRFVKVWRPDEDASIASAGSISPLRSADSATTPKPTGYQKQRVLAGKNCLLGDLLDANFTAAVPIGPDRAIVCAESGEICLLEDAATSHFLRAVAKVDFLVTAAAIDQKGALRVAGPSGCYKIFTIDSLMNGDAPSPIKRRQTSIHSRMISDATVTTAMATIHGITVELDSHRGIRLSRPEEDDDDDRSKAVSSHQLPAHNDTVLGVKPFSSDDLPTAAFLTFSTNGSVRIWDAEGCSCASLGVPVENSPEMYDLPNELKAAAAIDSGARVAAGDRYGSLSILDVATNTVVTRVRAHSAEVVDLIAFERAGVQLIVSGSRDRMIQLFIWRDSKLELLQTMDEHAGAVNGLLSSNNGDSLLSCSADRTIVVREAMLRSEGDPASIAFLMLRTISLKSSPVSMCLEASDSEILVSTMDRFIGKYNLRSGQAGFNFKCSDSEGGESTAIGKVLYAPSLNGNPTIIGVSSGDKSVRLYSEYGTLIARDWGHTEGIMDVMMLAPPSPFDASGQRNAPKLVTVAADSTIFIWNTASPATLASNSSSQQHDPNDSTESLTSTITTKTLTPMAPPLRKVLSYSELSRYRAREKSFDDANSPSPSSASALNTPTAPPSPPRLVRKKTSRVSLAQPPKLEPAFRSSSYFPDGGAGSVGSGRRSLRRRSPSPPSPRNSNYSTGVTSRRDGRRPSLATSLRSKSSDGALNQFSSSTSAANNNGGAYPSSAGGLPPLPSNSASSIAAANANANASPFGSLTASTESVCRTLRAYRKKLSHASAAPAASSPNSSATANSTSTNAANSSSSQQQNHYTLDSLSPDTLRELEKELKLTARVVGEKFLLAVGQKAQMLDESAMTKLLEKASDRIVGLLDARIRERLEGGEGEGGEDEEDEKREEKEQERKGDAAAAALAADAGVVGEKDVELIGREDKVRVLAGALAEVKLGNL